MSINGKSTINANNSEALGMLELKKEQIVMVISRSRNLDTDASTSVKYALRNRTNACDRPPSDTFENQIDTKSLLTGNEKNPFFKNLAG